jgi:uncharacterized protein
MCWRSVRRCWLSIEAEVSRRTGGERSQILTHVLANWESIPIIQDMITRIGATQVRRQLGKFPAVGILGPRQCGKTTLAQRLGGVYFDLEDSGSEARLDAEWDSLMADSNLIILDEAQQAPWIFKRLRGAIDRDRKRNGRFLLTGSVAPSLMKGISESLAGRLALVRLTPFVLPELKVRQLDELWLCGGYPDGGILERRMFPDWQSSYLDAIVSRDLPAWGLPAKPQLTMRLLHMLATVHGQQINASQLGASLSLNHKTVISYCDFLEGAFLIRRLNPYFANTKKRLVKLPRVCWRDSGLLHALSGVKDLDHLYNQAWVGASWEGFVIEQTLATLDARGVSFEPYYFRTSDGFELDLVLDLGAERWAVEVKMTSSPSSGTLARMQKTADMIQATRRVLVCRIARKIEAGDLLVTNLSGWLKSLV